MALHIVNMCTNISEDLQVEIDCINIKATTEKLRFEGRKEGIAVQAVVLVEKLGFLFFPTCPRCE